jgi:Tyrosine phosphatase family
LVIACLRKLQCWSISSTMAEFGRYCLVTPAYTSFIESFQVEIEVRPRQCASHVIDNEGYSTMVVQGNWTSWKGGNYRRTSDLEIEILPSRNGETGTGTTGPGRRPTQHSTTPTIIDQIPLSILLKRRFRAKQARQREHVHLRNRYHRMISYLGKMTG